MSERIEGTVRVMVRHRDSWRIGSYVCDVGDDVLVRVAGKFDVWPGYYVEHIAPEDLDRALMQLHNHHPAPYASFLTTMLGLDT